MDGNFDAKAEAVRIEEMAKKCLHDDPVGHLIDTHNDERALAKELVSIWGDNNKMLAVGSELQNINDTCFTTLPNVTVDYHPETRSISSLAFTASEWDSPPRYFRVTAVNNSQSVDLAVDYNGHGKNTLNWSEPLSEAPKNK